MINKIITIDTITGLSPYNVYVCDDDTYNQCTWIDEISSAPYSFPLPYPYNTSCDVFIKIIDDNGCEMINTINICP